MGLGGGVYKLINRNDGYLLEVGSDAMSSGAPMDLYHDKYDPPGVSNQQWHIVKVSNGNYKLLNTHSGLALHATASGVDQAADSGVADNEWQIREVGRPGR